MDRTVHLERKVMFVYTHTFLETNSYAKHFIQAILKLFLRMNRMDGLTGGVSGVDDAEDSGLAVLFSSLVCSVELVDIQSPAVVLVQVVIDLHCAQFSDGGRVQRVLRDGDHHPCTVSAFARHQQLQDGLRNKRISVSLLAEVAR